MWISTKAQYGLRALIDIAQQDGKAVALKNVADRQEISQHYLEQIAAALRRAGFIRSVRGAHGGYKLARSPESITAWEVVSAMEGSLAPVSCIEDPGSCGHTGVCGTENLWKRVDLAVRSVLLATSLQDLIAEQQLAEVVRQKQNLEHHGQAAMQLHLQDQQHLPVIQVLP
jgi:Rrf2 family transcriptional regulator, cysteine metabolism repressor